MYRKTLAFVICALVALTVLSSTAISEGDDPVLYTNASGRAFNTTEYLGYTTSSPTVDGIISDGEYDDASTFHFQKGSKESIAYFMYDDEQIYIAIDAISDVTDDQEGPTSGQLINSNSDYYIISIDGDDDGDVTYQNIPWAAPQNEMYAEAPVSYGGLCVDRGATVAGNDFAIAGWLHYNLAGTGVTMWHDNTNGGVNNNGAGEPYDQINTSFDGHRQYEHSIAYTGPWDALSLGHGDTFGIGLYVKDKSAGPTVQIPDDADGVGPTYQTFTLMSKPRAWPKITTDPMDTGPPAVYPTGLELAFDGSDSVDDGTISSFKWDFGDGSTVTTGETATHTYADPGTYIVSLEVEDDDNIKDLRSLPVQIIVAPELPEISGAVPTEADLTVPEGEGLDLSVDYDDANLGLGIGEELEITWKLDGVVVKSEKSKIDAGTTTYKFETTYDGKNSFKDIPYVLEVIVDDTYDFNDFQNLHNVTLTWNITVTETNRAPTFTEYQPDFDKVIINEGETQKFQILKSDPDGNTMSVAWFVDGTEDTTARGKDLLTYPALPSFESAGEYVIFCRIVDNGLPILETRHYWNLTINNVNQAPTINTQNPALKTPQVDEGKTITLSVSTTDKDADDLIYTWYLNDGPLDVEESSYDFMPDYKASRNSPYTIRVDVSDGDPYLEPASAEWTVTVKDIDQPTDIVVNSPSEDEYYLADLIDFDASSTVDLDEDSSDSLSDDLEFTWDFGDEGTKEGQTVKHQYEAPGQYSVTLTVVTTHEGKETEKYWSKDITILGAELNVDSITVGAVEATEKDIVPINVTLQNVGSIDAEQVEVELIMGGSATGLKQIIDVPAGSYTTIQFEWTARKGNYAFSARIGTNPNVIVLDQSYESDSIEVKAKGSGGGGGGAGAVAGGDNSLLFIVAAVLIVVVVMGVLAFTMHRKKKQKAMEEKIRLEEEERQRQEAERQRQEEEARRAAEAERFRQEEAQRQAAAAAAAAAAARQQSQVRHPVFKPTPKAQSPRPAMFKTAPAAQKPRPAAFKSTATAPRGAGFSPAKTGEEKIASPKPTQAGPTVCPKCSEDVEPGWAKCPACSTDLKGGTPPPKPTAPPKPAPPTKPPAVQGASKCPKCGEDVEPDWLKCPDCGNDLKK